MLELQEEILPPKGIPMPFDGLAGGLQVSTLYEARDFPAQTGRERYEPLMVLLQELSVDSGFIVKAFDVAGSDQPNQILVAGHVLGQQDQMVAARLAAAGAGALLGTAARGHIDLAADDRLELGLLYFFSLPHGCSVESHDAEHRPMVGQCQGGELELFGPSHQFIQAACSIQKREL